MLKDNPSVTVVLDGYASPEGKKARNELLAKNRTEAAQKALLAEGIPASRISANPKGVWEIQKESWSFVRKVHFRIAE